MLSFVDGLQEHYDLFIYLIIALIFGFIFIIVFLFSNKKKKYSNQLEKLKAKYKKIDELPIMSSINKIEELAKRNISFSNISNAYVKRYCDYAEKFSTPITEMVNSINAMINDAKYDLADERINALSVLISAYEKDAEMLLAEIKELTIDEEPLKRDLDRIRKTYSECIRKYQENANDLHLVYPKIRDIMERIDLMISEADDNIQAGIYNETKELVNKIDLELDFLNEYLRVMPQLINLATKIIIKNLNDLIEKNNIMQDEFPLHHLMPFKNIEKLKKDVENSIERIKELDYEGVEPLLKDINNNISTLSMALDNERECKKEYDNKCENLYYSSDCTIRNFDHVKKDIEKVLLDYERSDEITDFLKKCEYYQLLVKDDKQKMDNNIYGHQPYSVRLENMNKLSNSIADFQQHLDTFSNVVKNLEIERIKCIGNIEGYINYLRLSQIILEKSNLPALEKRYKETINNIEDLISRLINSLRRPYKIKVAKDICHSLDQECKDLYGKVKYSQKLMVFCEKIIVIASRYRDKFQEVDYAVNRASFYFLDGDFEACKNIIEKLSSYGIVFPKFSEVEARV